MIKIFKISIFIFFMISANIHAETVKVFEFTDEEFKTLKVRKIRGAKSETDYTLDANKNGPYLRAVASGGASGLGKEIEIDLNKTPYLNITWRVEKDLTGIDEQSKKGHDFAARVFVVKKTGLTPLSNKAINYVFSSNFNIDDYWRSPYTKSSIDYVLSTTKKNLNEWVTVKANVKDHFKLLHNIEVDKITGIALMTDTDQTNISAIANYQNIFFSAN